MSIWRLYSRCQRISDDRESPDVWICMPENSRYMNSSWGVASPDHRYVPVRVGEGVLVNEFGERGPSARLVLIIWQCAAKFLQYSLLL